MRNGIIVLILIIFSYIILGNFFVEKNLIPDEAIRVRIIANSNSQYDQEIKFKVKNVVENNLYNLLKNTEDIEQAKLVIKDNLYNVENNINALLIKEKYPLPFNINFGLNYFPDKKFKGVVYNEGYYDSVVVTLGEGLGDNWWCVLFPPLCMIEAEESTNVEYTTMIKTIIDKYF